jgi:hypothetical protein
MRDCEVTCAKPNEAAPVSAPIALRFQIGHPGRRVTEQRR